MEYIQDILDILDKQIELTETNLMNAIYDSKNNRSNEFLNNHIIHLQVEFDMLMRQKAQLLGINE